MTTIIILGLVAAVAVFYGIFLYNRLVALRQGCRQAFADIDVQLKQRADLVPNLVSTVKGYAAHESSVFDNVTRARNLAQSATTTAEAATADGMMTAALGRLIAVAEAYPELKASQNFSQLSAELSDVENKVAAARRFLNLAVNEYNSSIEQFPAVLIAKRMGFSAETMFAVAAEQRAAVEAAPTVSF